MSTQRGRDRLELLQGTLDLPMLRTLIFGSRHGQGAAGRRQLGKETTKWKRLAAAIGRVPGPEET